MRVHVNQAVEKTVDIFSFSVPCIQVEQIKKHIFTVKVKRGKKVLFEFIFRKSLRGVQKIETCR